MTGTIIFLAFLAFLALMAYLDTYIGKSSNNNRYNNSKYNEDSSYGDYDDEDYEAIPEWKLYTGNPMYIPAPLKRQYLQSIEWEALKLLRLIIAKDRCECCGSTTRLELHHVTYERLTNEDIDDVRIVCRSCHQNIHDKLGTDRTTKYPIT